MDIMDIWLISHLSHFFSFISLISGIFHESIVFGLNLNCLKWIQIQMIVFAFGVFLLTPIGNYFFISGKPTINLGIVCWLPWTDKIKLGLLIYTLRLLDTNCPILCTFKHFHEVR